jgi:hypothetical protein
MNNHLALLAYTKELLSKEFEMIDNGEIAYCFSIQVKQNRKLKKIHLSQENISMTYWPDLKWIHAIL